MNQINQITIKLSHVCTRAHTYMCLYIYINVAHPITMNQGSSQRQYDKQRTVKKPKEIWSRDHTERQ